MLNEAASGLGLDLKKSFVVGDREGDVALAFRAGARSVLVRTGFGEGGLAWNAKNWPQQPEVVAADLSDAVEWILKGVERWAGARMTLEKIRWIWRGRRRSP